MLHDNIAYPLIRFTGISFCWLSIKMLQTLHTGQEACGFWRRKLSCSSIMELPVPFERACWHIHVARSLNFCVSCHVDLFTKVSLSTLTSFYSKTGHCAVWILNLVFLSPHDFGSSSSFIFPYMYFKNNLTTVILLQNQPQRQTEHSLVSLKISLGLQQIYRYSFKLQTVSL